MFEQREIAEVCQGGGGDVTVCLSERLWLLTLAQSQQSVLYLVTSVVLLWRNRTVCPWFLFICLAWNATPST